MTTTKRIKKNFRIYYDPKYHHLIPGGILEGDHHAYWETESDHGMNAHAAFWMNSKATSEPIKGCVTEIYCQDPLPNWGEKSEFLELEWYPFATSLLKQYEHLGE